MINPRELMLGNYVYDRGGKVLRIDMFEYDGFAMRNEVNGQLLHPWTEDFEYANPIPLTVEWLDKWYFEVIDDNPKQKPHYQGDVIVKILGYEFTNSMVDGFKCYELCSERGGVTIKYVHQLQNLYFFLSGHELTIKP
jgi:hypothetical protein